MNANTQFQPTKIYMLYGYNNHRASPVKYIFGTYYNTYDVVNRINNLCVNTGFTESYGTYHSNDGRMTYFVNVLPVGDQRTELFTT